MRAFVVLCTSSMAILRLLYVDCSVIIRKVIMIVPVYLASWSSWSRGTDVPDYSKFGLPCSSSVVAFIVSVSDRRHVGKEPAI